MYEIIEDAQKITSIALLIGRGACNARCQHCAGAIHRSGAPKKDGVIDEELIETVLRKCYLKGARSLSISSGGEPTLSPKSVTKTLKIASDLRKEGMVYSSIHLYSNGIRIGEDKKFASQYLPLWRNLGLRTIYITVHDVDPVKNAKIYGVKKYPNLEVIVKRAHFVGIAVRANLVFSKYSICTLESFSSAVVALYKMGFDAVSGWSIRDPNHDQVDQLKAPDKEELEKMAAWAITNSKIYNMPIKVLLEEDHLPYKNGWKLTLFPDGALSNAWCK
jgi:MoaA/NifB/PqqE/SkfB family radical SAM enzyme